jgi:2,3-dihydroxyphenylpropionate 1,2-dioxygenase
MSLAVAALSHAPSFGNVDPGGTVFAEINEGIEEVRAFVRDYAPDVVVVFGPDHFNGVLYSMMPPFAIGAQAVGVGDYGTGTGDLPVDSAFARRLHELVLAQGIDIARSEKLEVDHGVMQPMEFVFGEDFRQPFVPVFVNAIGRPLSPMARIRLMGEAVGRAALETDERVLLMASGGLSHNPPIPVYDAAPVPVQERLVTYSPTREERQEREGKIIAGIQAIADGRASSEPLNEEWDRRLLDVFRSGDLRVVDGWDNDEFIREGGSAAHEMRSWIAAFSGLSVAGDYRLSVDRYWAVPTWGAGFGIVAAVTA